MAADDWSGSFFWSLELCFFFKLFFFAGQGRLLRSMRNSEVDDQNSFIMLLCV